MRADVVNAAGPVPGINLLGVGSNMFSLRWLVKRVLPGVGLVLFMCVMEGVLAGCDRAGSNTASDTVEAEASGKVPRVASIVPAATDLIYAMGAGEHLVAVSNYDTGPGIDTKLPRVGDLNSTDWEMLTKLKPQFILVQTAESRLPFGFMEHCQRLEMTAFRCEFERLDDIYGMVDRLGMILQEKEKSEALIKRIHADLDKVHLNAQDGRARPRVLLIVDAKNEHIVGPGNYLRDIVEWIGANNAGDSLPGAWPSVDREQLLKLGPEFIFYLLPDAKADAEQTVRGSWNGADDIPAVKNNQIYVLRDWYVLQAGSHVVNLAAQMSEIIRKTHPVGWPLPADERTSAPASAVTSAPARKITNTPTPIPPATPLPRLP